MTGLLPHSLEMLMTRASSVNVQDLPPLRPSKPFDPSLSSSIDDYVKTNHNNKSSLRVALHLLNDDIDRAHPIAQGDEGNPTTDLCHAILHRREAQYWNARLWYKLINHPLISEVYGSTGQAITFINQVEAMVAFMKGASLTDATGDIETLKQKQAKELIALVRFAMQGK
jgi:hypothetical protein